MDGGEVGNHHAKSLGLIHAAEDLSTDSLQFIRDLVGQGKYEGGVNRLKWDVEPRAVVERNQLRLSGLGLEIHDEVFGEGVLVPDLEHGEKLVEMGLGEFGIDGEPYLRALVRGSNDSTLRSVCGLLWRVHIATFL